MRIQVENVSAASLAFVFFIGAIVGGAFGASAVHHTTRQELGEYELQLKLLREGNTITEKLLASSGCPESVFQEKTIMLPDGGVYKCGAVRMIPVNQKELERWYKAEARKLLKAER